ncbi:MAG: hypothetical protein HDR10_07900 [Lachnospiraceae bacterium]|nr:hypothetical protein [Lachnospiraceae bacterium]
MKKLIAIALAGAMVFSLPVMAADIEETSPSASDIVSSGSWSGTPCGSNSSVPVEAVVSSSASDAAAAEEGKTVGEYLNNAVIEVAGLESVTPVGQGGHVIINGAPSNVTFMVEKPDAAAVKSAKTEAALLGGKVLNVVSVNSIVGKFKTARVNYYLKGIKAGQNIKVYQLVKNSWVELTVVEIGEDHVVVDMTSLGTLMFVEVPTVPAAE